MFFDKEADWRDGSSGVSSSTPTDARRRRDSGGGGEESDEVDGNGED